MAWDDQKVEKLRIYWARGYTASEIARALGEGVTRNSVIGKAHRLKLAARAPSKKSKFKSPEKQDATNNLNKQEGRISKKIDLGHCFLINLSPLKIQNNSKS
jgi:GcrA cell cycle regulator